MISYPIHTDIVALLRLQTQALQSLADANQVTLSFKSTHDKFNLEIQPEVLITDFVQLLSKVIIFTPQEHEVNVLISNHDTSSLIQIHVFADGALLALPENTLLQLNNKVMIKRRENQGTQYTMNLPVERNTYLSTDISIKKEVVKQKIAIPDFYKKFRTQLKSHITTYQKLEKRASEISEHDGILLKKVNAIILANLDNESFNTPSLAQSLALSRTQLYRKLKPLIRQSPAKYIRFVRLQKAKELLLTTDLSIGDVGDNVGFPDQSHFTRAFKNHYGYKPSQIKNRTGEHTSQPNLKSISTIQRKEP